MHTSITPAPAALLAEAARFADEVVAPQAALWESERRIGREALDAAAAIGLTRLEVPTAWGGLGLGFGAKAQIAEALAAADFAFTMSWINTHNVAAKLARDARPEVARRYVDDLIAGRRLGCTALTEAAAGSDFAAIRTLATRTAQGWRIDGGKAWITNATESDVIVLYAQTEAALAHAASPASSSTAGVKASSASRPSRSAASTPSAPAASVSTATWPMTTNCCIHPARPSRRR